MSVFVIWVDRKQAKLFQFSQDKMERMHLEAKHNEHHTHELDALDAQRDEKKFYSEIALHLMQAKQLLILGPGIAKYHFQNYLMEHVPALAKKIVACETVDHPSDPQIAALAKRYFDAHPEKFNFA